MKKAMQRSAPGAATRGTEAPARAWRWGLLALMLAAGCGAWAPARAAAPPGPGYARPDLLVETAWLDENSIRPEIVVVDVRSREIYDQVHIPNAAWVDENALVERDGHRLFMPAPEKFRSMMESAGITDGSHVVVVDDVGGRAAARLWWTLGYFGFERVSILNGGYLKWEAEGRATTVEMPFARTGSFTPKPRPERAVKADQVKAWKSNPGAVILDARAPAEFEGRSVRSKRAGHIPGAKNVPWEGNLAERDGHLLIKPAADLLEIYRKAGVTERSPVLVYDHDGRRAPHLLFALALIGLNASGVHYVGGWAEWSEQPDLPVEGAPAGGPGASKAAGKASGKAAGKAPAPAAPEAKPPSKSKSGP